MCTLIITVQPMTSAQVADTKRLTDAIRRANHKYLIADLHLVRVTERHGRNTFRHFFELQQSQIRLNIRADDAGDDSWPSGNSTLATSAVWTTCAAVKTFPSLEISTPDPKPSMIAIGSSAEGATSTRLVLTMTTEWLTLRKASRSCCAFVVIDNVENVSRLSTKMNGDLILMVAANRNNRSRPKIAGYTDDRNEKGS